MMDKIIKNNYKAIVIGGSAGSFNVVSSILANIKSDYQYPIIICMHRLKHVRSGLVEGLRIKSKLPVIEPYDKSLVTKGNVYLAPANYHMFIDIDGSISLSTEKQNNNSRPSIDYTFSSAANVFRDKVVGILLTGANSDGAFGMKILNSLNGFTIVQDPNTCDVPTMTKAALKMFQPDKILSPNQIIDFLNQL